MITRNGGKRRHHETFCNNNVEKKHKIALPVIPLEVIGIPLLFQDRKHATGKYFYDQAVIDNIESKLSEVQSIKIMGEGVEENKCKILHTNAGGLIHTPPQYNTHHPATITYPAGMLIAYTTFSFFDKTVSHICHRNQCVNILHLTYEHISYNNARKKCARILKTKWERNDVVVIDNVKRYKGCGHTPKCMWFKHIEEITTVNTLL